MGSSSAQSLLWGQYPQDWSSIQESTGIAGYEYVLAKTVRLSQAGASLLDIGCGSGLFAGMAKKAGFRVTGLDATPPLIHEARKRATGIQFFIGDMEELPFEDESFSIVTGFNSFQYAADTLHALKEAGRILKEKGMLAAMIWGKKEDCEAATFLKAVGSLLPPPPPGAGGPFALTDNSLLEKTLGEAGFSVLSSEDIPSTWDYPDQATAMKGLLSAGPSVKAIQHSGYEKVYDTVAASVQPFVQPDGHVIYHNKFRIVLASKSS